MKKWMLILAAVLALAVHGAVAEAADPYAVQRENAMAAMRVSLPEATLDYAVRERDDGRYVWNLFYTQGETFGVCRVDEEKNEISRVEIFAPEAGALKASEAMALLAQQKGALTVTELEIDRDGGSLRYEGEAELDGRRYEFEIGFDGEIIEWERD